MTHPTDLLEAYVLSLLSPAQEREIRAHLEACPTCQKRVTALEETLGVLAYAAPIEQPPTAAEDRLFARIAQLRQGEPIRATAPQQPAEAELARTTMSALMNYRRLPIARPWLVSTGAIAAVVVLILFAVLALRHNGSTTLSLQAQLDQQARSSLHTTNSTLYHLTPTPDGPRAAIGALAVDRMSNTGVLVVAHMPSTPLGKVYEFWLVQVMASSTMTITVPTGTFTVTNEGRGELRFTARYPLTTLQNAGISLEYAGGVTTPDSSMLMLFAPTSP